MLKESRLPPAELPLANIVPPDHFFAYFSSLRAFRETFDGGSDLFVRLESTLSAKSIEYDQKAAYLSRLGLSESILNELEAGGAIRGIGFVAPDLDCRQAATFIAATLQGSAGAVKNARDPAILDACRSGLVRYLESLRAPVLATVT